MKIILLLLIIAVAVFAAQYPAYNPVTESPNVVGINQTVYGGGIYAAKLVSINPQSDGSYKATFYLYERVVLKAIITLKENETQPDPGTGIHLYLRTIYPLTNYTYIQADFTKQGQARGIALLQGSNFTEDMYTAKLINVDVNAGKATYETYAAGRLLNTVLVNNGQDYLDEKSGIRIYQFSLGVGMNPGDAYADVVISTPTKPYEFKGKYQVDVESWSDVGDYGIFPKKLDRNVFDKPLSYEMDIYYKGKFVKSITMLPNSNYSQEDGFSIKMYSAPYKFDIDVTSPLDPIRGHKMYLWQDFKFGNTTISLSEIRDSENHTGYPDRAFFNIDSGSLKSQLTVYEGSWAKDDLTNVRIYLFSADNFGLNDTYADVAWDIPNTPQAGKFDPDSPEIYGLPTPTPAIPTPQPQYTIAVLNQASIGDSLPLRATLNGQSITGLEYSITLNGQPIASGILQNDTTFKPTAPGAYMLTIANATKTIQVSGLIATTRPTISATASPNTTAIVSVSATPASSIDLAPLAYGIILIIILAALYFIVQKAKNIELPKKEQKEYVVRKPFVKGKKVKEPPKEWHEELGLDVWTPDKPLNKEDEDVPEYVPPTKKETPKKKK